MADGQPITTTTSCLPLSTATFCMCEIEGEVYSRDMQQQQQQHHDASNRVLIAIFRLGLNPEKHGCGYSQREKALYGVVAWAHRCVVGLFNGLKMTALFASSSQVSPQSLLHLSSHLSGNYWTDGTALHRAGKWKPSGWTRIRMIRSNPACTPTRLDDEEDSCHPSEIQGQKQECAKPHAGQGWRQLCGEVQGKVLSCPRIDNFGPSSTAIKVHGYLQFPASSLIIRLYTLLWCQVGCICTCTSIMACRICRFHKHLNTFPVCFEMRHQIVP